MKVKHLKKRTEFLDVLSNGKKIKSGVTTLYYVREKGGNGPQTGVIITKQNARTATKRNYLKRVIYSFFNSKAEDMVPDVKIVARLSADINSMKNRELGKKVREELEKALTQAQIT